MLEFEQLDERDLRALATEASSLALRHAAARSIASTATFLLAWKALGDLRAPPTPGQVDALLAVDALPPAGRALGLVARAAVRMDPASAAEAAGIRRTCGDYSGAAAALVLASEIAEARGHRGTPEGYALAAARLLDQISVFAPDDLAAVALLRRMRSVRERLVDLLSTIIPRTPFSRPSWRRAPRCCASFAPAPTPTHGFAKKPSQSPRP